MSFETSSGVVADVVDGDRRVVDGRDRDRDGRRVVAARPVADGVAERIGSGVVGGRRVADLAGLDRGRAVARAADARDRQCVAVDIGVVGADVDELRGVLGRRRRVVVGDRWVVDRGHGDRHRTVSMPPRAVARPCSRRRRARRSPPPACSGPGRPRWPVVPWLGVADARDRRAASPSMSVSLARTSMSVEVSSGVDAVSSTATGGSLTAVTVTATEPVSVSGGAVGDGVVEGVGAVVLRRPGRSGPCRRG